MELLQKITLYDLLGYALPGCVLLYIWKWSDVFAAGDVPASAMIVFVGLGYLAGILIAELSELVSGIWKKSKRAKAAIEKEMEIAPETIRKALFNAGVLRETDEAGENTANAGIADRNAANTDSADRSTINAANTANADSAANVCTEDDYGLLWNYFTNMYADIQTDKNCSRLHNYASAELLYKNMACVSAISAGRFLWGQQWVAMLLAVAAAVLFLNRWRRFTQKKVLYTVYWYAAKYLNKTK